MLFNFHIFVSFPVFLLPLISSFILLCSEKLLGMIPVVLNSLGQFFVPHLWSILENSLYPLEKNVYSATVAWSVLYISVRCNWSIVLFKSSVSLWIYYLIDLSIIKAGYCIEIVYYCCVTVYFSLQFCQCLLHIFGCSAVSYIYL